VRESPVGKDLNMEDDESRVSVDVTQKRGENKEDWEDSMLCSSESQSVRIKDSVRVTCSYEFQESNKSDYQSKYGL
jgi:hypothetical protein